MDPLVSEVLKQAPAVGVGLFVFLAYQKLVVKLQDIIAASTAAMVASTAAMVALSKSVEESMVRAQERHGQVMTAVDAVPGKALHDFRNEQARILREALERR